MNWSDLKAKKLTPTQNYIAGFVFSLILTIIPYYIVVNEKLSGWSLLFSLMGYAVLQFVVQVLFFLHLGDEKKPRWNLVSLIFVLAVVIFIVVGSIWIMHNLMRYHGNSSPEDISKQLLEDQNYTRQLQDLENHQH